MALDSDMVASCGRDLNALGLDKGPTYSGARLDYKSFWYDMEPFCMLKGLGHNLLWPLERFGGPLFLDRIGSRPRAATKLAAIRKVTLLIETCDGRW